MSTEECLWEGSRKGFLLEDEFFLLWLLLLVTMRV